MKKISRMCLVATARDAIVLDQVMRIVTSIRYHQFTSFVRCSLPRPLYPLDTLSSMKVLLSLMFPSGDIYVLNLQAGFRLKNPLSC